MLMIVLGLSSGRPTLADGVCGDSTMDAGEQCDDGNLTNGDGCSSKCTVEKCGNGVIDANEQCDDANTSSGDGCNQYCQIEFCGDHVVQSSLGEECDDGNGVSGDGCSSTCKGNDQSLHPASENKKDQTKQDSAAPVGDGSDQSTTPVEAAQAAVARLIQSQAVAASIFLASPDGQDYKAYLNREEGIQLEQIIQKIENRRYLSVQERAWAVQLYAKLTEAKVAERLRYTDLLKQFIATPISSEVVTEKSLAKTRLVDVEVPVAIGELKRAVTIIQRGQLKQQVTLDIDKLHRQGISIEANVPLDYQQFLSKGNRPIEVFTTLKSLKEATEKFATNNLPASLEIIRAGAEDLKKMLPIFEREYRLKPVDAQSFLNDIQTTSNDVTNQDAYRIVSAVNRFLLALERQKIISSADLVAGIGVPHAAAGVERMTKEVGDNAVVPQTTDIRSFVQGMTTFVPTEYKEIFANGTLEDQRAALLQFLRTDDRATALMDTMRKSGRKDFDQRFDELRAQILRVGTITDTDTTCDDSMPDALQCTATFLHDLQDTVRSQSVYSRVVGWLQDYFGIGQ